MKQTWYTYNTLEESKLKWNSEEEEKAMEKISIE
jgi:hypothetical protein